MPRKKSTDPRGGIDASALIEALQLHALGEQKMTATQVSAAIALLKKILPDIPGSLLKEEAPQEKTHEEALKELE